MLAHDLHYVDMLMIMMIAMVFIIVVFDCFGRPGEILTSHDLALCLQENGGLFFVLFCMNIDVHGYCHCCR